MNKYYLLALIPFFVISCNTNINKTKSNNFELVVDSSKTIKLPIDSTTIFTSSSIQYINELKKLLILTENANRLNIFNLDSNKLEKKIDFEYEGPNSVGQISGFYYHNPDSIFVFSEYAYKVYLCNINGKVLDKTIELRENNSHYPIPKSITFQKLFYNNHKLYFSGAYANLLLKQNNINPFFSYDLITKKAKHLGKVPKRIEGKNWETLDELFCDFVPPNSFVLSSSVLDSLKIINIKNNKTISFVTKSNFFNIDDIGAFSNNPETKPKDYIERAKYTIKSPKFWGVLYNPYKEIFYRFVIYKNTYKEFVAGNYSKIGILVFNKNYEKISESIIPDGYEPEMSFVTPDGLFIANNNAYEENDNYIQFDCFKLSKK